MICDKLYELNFNYLLTFYALAQKISKLFLKIQIFLV